eukprot:TRINITY_DN1139_c0_g1_i1.p1 TRINITY_DN1139_c0_g1~~TRINITY_DN1139_c0_g1_i1.p1  ORF type:complete len:531 (-),score=35.17 TRINITY_DN1139_c0_g1_i1:1681-3273(-)
MASAPPAAPGHWCTFCSTPLPDAPRLKCIVCVDVSACPDCHDARAEAAGHTRNHPFRVVNRSAVVPLPGRGSLDRTFSAEDHIASLEALLSAGHGSWPRIARILGRPSDAADIPMLHFELRCLAQLAATESSLARHAASASALLLGLPLDPAVPDSSDEGPSSTGEGAASIGKGSGSGSGRPPLASGDVSAQCSSVNGPTIPATSDAAAATACPQGSSGGPPVWLAPIGCCPVHFGRIPSKPPSDASLGGDPRAPNDAVRRKAPMYSYARRDFVDESPLERSEEAVEGMVELMAKRPMRFVRGMEEVDAAIAECGGDPAVDTVEDLTKKNNTFRDMATKPDHPLSVALDLAAHCLLASAYARALDRRAQRVNFLVNWGMVRWERFVDDARRRPRDELAKADLLRPVARYCGWPTAFRHFVSEFARVERMRKEVAVASARTTVGGTINLSAVDMGQGAGAADSPSSGFVHSMDGGEFLSPADVEICLQTKQHPSAIHAQRVAAAFGCSISGLSSLPAASGSGSNRRARAIT